MTNTNELLNTYVVPDEWKTGSNLEKSDGYKDDSFSGCEYRLASGSFTNVKYAVNVVITGRKIHDIGQIDSDWYRVKIKIEFVGDGEPSTFSGGWLHSNDYSKLKKAIESQ